VCRRYSRHGGPRSWGGCFRSRRRHTRSRRGGSSDVCSSDLSVNEANQDHLNTQLAEVKHNLKVNPELDDKYIVDAIYTIRQIKQKRRQINREQQELDNITKNLNDFDTRVSEEVSDFGIHYKQTYIFH